MNELSKAEIRLRIVEAILKHPKQYSLNEGNATVNEAKEIEEYVIQSSDSAFAN